MPEPAGEYTCALCKGTFGKGRSDEEALAEMEARFGPVSLQDCAVVCDDCWKWLEIARTITRWRHTDA